MPFPFHVLPYGLRQRIRELVTPPEAYDLQIAVGNDTSGLQPVTILKTIQSVEICDDDAEDVIIGQGLFNFKDQTISEIPQNTVFNATDYLKLKHTTENVLNNPVFHYLHLKNTEGLIIHANMVTQELLQLLAQKVSPTTLELKFRETEVLLPDIFSMFANIQSLAYSNLYCGWARDLANAAKRNICFSNYNVEARFEDVFNFDAGDVDRLLKDNWSLFLYCTLSDDMDIPKAKSDITKYMGSNFKRADSSNGIRLCVSLKKVALFGASECTNIEFILNE
uniref:FTH domain-containing protein n=1 Tax=Panagrellus redivivus TaxID=6233 RepID=A0A7E5A1B6_PANRE